MDKQWRGIFTIPTTPFDDRGALDEASLRREVQFCVEAGAHGIVCPVNASEFWTLSDDERKRVIRIVVEETAGRIPVVAGAAGVSDQHGAEMARYSQEVGADAVIAMPPYARPVPTPEVYAYYKAHVRRDQHPDLHPEPRLARGDAAEPRARREDGERAAARRLDQGGDLPARARDHGRAEALRSQA